MHVQDFGDIREIGGREVVVDQLGVSRSTFSGHGKYASIVYGGEFMGHLSQGWQESKQAGYDQYTRKGTERRVEKKITTYHESK
jgi:hypothetical protein